jgi:hypothetical protein
MRKSNQNGGLCRFDIAKRGLHEVGGSKLAYACNQNNSKNVLIGLSKTSYPAFKG